MQSFQPEPVPSDRPIGEKRDRPLALIREFQFSGKPREIGRGHGEALRDEIAKAWEFYRGRFSKFPGEVLKQSAEHFSQVIAEYSWEYHEEIVGIAEGARMDINQITLLNARTEVMLHAASIAPECTALYFPETKLLGQNWDWAKELEPLICCMRIERQDGHQILTMTEPGIIGKIELNDKGLGTCLNILPGKAECDGVPVHVLLRSMLDQDSLEMIRARLLQVEIDGKLGTLSNVMVGDDRGKHAMFEFHGKQLTTVTAPGVACHTNHYLSGSEDLPEGYIGESSKARLERAGDLSYSTDQSVSAMKKVLLDQTDLNTPIFVTYRKYPAPFDFTIGTVATIVMNLADRSMEVALPNSKFPEFQRYSL